MTTFDLSVTDHLLSTTRAVRKRLDLERPVSREIINECLELSLQAPTGSNKQGWSWIIVTDPKKRAVLADLYRKGAGSYLQDAKNQASVQGGLGQDTRVFSSAIYLAEKLQYVPIHVIPCINIAHVPDDPPHTAWAGIMGSIIPAVWSFQLALRARGLGSTLTTLHLPCAKEVAELLGIPDGVMQVALLPVAYTIGTDFKPAKRPPVSNITHWNYW